MSQILNGWRPEVILPIAECKQHKNLVHTFNHAVRNIWKK